MSTKGGSVAGSTRAPASSSPGRRHLRVLGASGTGAASTGAAGGSSTASSVRVVGSTVRSFPRKSAPVVKLPNRTSVPSTEAWMLVSVSAFRVAAQPSGIATAVAEASSAAGSEAGSLAVSTATSASATSTASMMSRLFQRAPRSTASLARPTFTVTPSIS